MLAVPAGTMSPGGMGGVMTDAKSDDSDDESGFGYYEPTGNPIQTVGDKTFIQLDGVWTDTQFQPDTMTTQKVVFLSDDYFTLLDSVPALAEYFALGEQVIALVDGVAYEVVLEF